MTTDPTSDDHPMIPVPMAIRIVLEQTAERNQRTPIGIVRSRPQVGRILAQDIVMPEPGYPSYPASIMDGYAILLNENNTVGEQKVLYRIVDRSHAQDNTFHEFEPNVHHAVYVTTGAPVDPRATVIPVEHCRVVKVWDNESEERYLEILKTDSFENKWIRQVGSDIAPHTQLFSKGRVLTPIDMGILAQTGMDEVNMYDRTVRVGVLSTGTEVFQGRIPDANKPILLELIRAWGRDRALHIVGVDLECAPDDVVNLSEKLKEGLHNCDVIITTGGVSMGETDLLEKVLADLGARIHFGRLFMKPGKPTKFFTLENTLVFALPGNPVSATVCTHLLVRPCLELLVRGGTDINGAHVHAEVQVRLGQDIHLDPVRPEYHRVQLQYGSDGSSIAISTGTQRSSRLLSLQDADALLVLPKGNGVAKTGSSYKALILDYRQSLSVQKSTHLKVARHFHVGLMSWSRSLESTVKEALTGSKSGSVEMKSWNAEKATEYELWEIIVNAESDIFLLAAPLKGRFRDNLCISTMLREKLQKIADGIAMQVRLGCASVDPHAAAFETVVGFSGRTLVVFLPEEGIEGGLKHVRGLLKHAVEIACGTSIPH